MYNVLCLTGFILLLSACHARDAGTGATQHNPAPAPEAEGRRPAIVPASPNQKPPTDTVAFEEAFGRFFAALQTQDTALLNTFISPKEGFWLIEQPGAVPAYSHYIRVQDVKRQYQGQPFVSIAAQMQTCALQRHPFPAFDCAGTDNGGSGYAEDGCFYTSGAAFRQNDMWKYASLPHQQEQQVQQLQQRVLRSVLHTYTSFRFHFGYDGSQWQLLFVDLRVPCSA
ncbi:hypothetical protein [Pontibacter liquoris]|uniref:hypothetical protein n=1 Tax=Pontibacter liquoris TaxID=2905677 RepID=UPI001FA7E385|nr:hypothetical protein [Pontibacter liquoris]